MKNFFVGFFMLIITCSVFSQNVTNVESQQIGNKIEIAYHLDKNADIEIQISENGGGTYKNINKVSGDVGKNITAGNKKIIWDVLAERDKLQGDNIVFKVVAKFAEKNITFTVKGVSFDMIFVEGGTFTMGCTSEQGADCYWDEKPAHKVTVSDFHIGKYEVTQAQWKAVMGSNPSYFKGDDLPVENVSWNDVQEFIKKLNAQTGKNYRLPTEAEWEFAARGGNQSKGYKYSGSNNLDEVAWYSGNTHQTNPVGTKAPNELGIYDMSGNVLEWCSDWKAEYSSSSKSNPQGPATGFHRVFRGGSWGNFAGSVHVSFRCINAPLNRGSSLGFRLACSSNAWNIDMKATELKDVKATELKDVIHHLQY